MTQTDSATRRATGPGGTKGVARQVGGRSPARSRHRPPSKGVVARDERTARTDVLAARSELPVTEGLIKGLVSRAVALTEGWAPTAGRILLGLVLGWFGYHELVTPGLWTGYVPMVSPSSHVAELLVLAHGWVLLVLAVALVAGVAQRLSALIASALLVEIVISLVATGGLSDLVLRDVGVLGLSLAVLGARGERLALRR